MKNWQFCDFWKGHMRELIFNKQQFYPYAQYFCAASPATVLLADNGSENSLWFRSL